MRISCEMVKKNKILSLFLFALRKDSALLNQPASGINNSLNDLLDHQLKCQYIYYFKNMLVQLLYTVGKTYFRLNFELLLMDWNSLLMELRETNEPSLK